MFTATVLCCGHNMAQRSSIIAPDPSGQSSAAGSPLLCDHASIYCCSLTLSSSRIPSLLPHFQKKDNSFVRFIVTLPSGPTQSTRKILIELNQWFRFQKLTASFPSSSGSGTVFGSRVTLSLYYRLLCPPPGLATPGLQMEPPPPGHCLRQLPSSRVSARIDGGDWPCRPHQ